VNLGHPDLRETGRREVRRPAGEDAVWQDHAPSTEGPRSGPAWRRYLDSGGV